MYKQPSAFTAAITIDDTLYMWGSNDYGQLGLGDVVNRSTPTQVGSDEDWLKVATGTRHTAAIKKNGSLYTWGANTQGQLGHGDNESRSTPTLLTSPLMGWYDVKCGESVTVALDADNVFWTWGLSPREGLTAFWFGEDPNSGDFALPYPILGEINNIKDIWAGKVLDASNYVNTRVPFIKTNNEMWLWNVYNQTESPIQFIDGSWKGIYGANYIIRDDDTLWAYGDYGYNIGVQDSAYLSTPVQVITGVEPETWKFVNGDGASRMGGLGVKTDGTLWVWGYINGFEYSNKYIKFSTTPILFDSATDWKSVIRNNYNGEQFGGWAIKEDGSGWVWGWSLSYNGNGGIEVESIDIPAPFFPEIKWRKIVSNTINNYTGASGGITEDGLLYLWGQTINHSTQATASITANGAITGYTIVNPGDGYYFKPYLQYIEEDGFVFAPSDWKAVTVSGYSTYGIRENGSLWCNSTSTSRDINSFVNIGLKHYWIDLKESKDLSTWYDSVIALRFVDE